LRRLLFGEELYGRADDFPKIFSLRPVNSRPCLVSFHLPSPCFRQIICTTAALVLGFFDRQASLRAQGRCSERKRFSRSPNAKKGESKHKPPSSAGERQPDTQQVVSSWTRTLVVLVRTSGGAVDKAESS